LLGGLVVGLGWLALRRPLTSLADRVATTRLRVAVTSGATGSQPQT